MNIWNCSLESNHSNWDIVPELLVEFFCLGSGQKLALLLPWVALVLHYLQVWPISPSGDTPIQKITSSAFM